MSKKKAQRIINEYNVAIVAIIGLVIIEVVALLKGVNGTLMILICSAIAGLGGWISPQLKLDKIVRG